MTTEAFVALAFAGVVFLLWTLNFAWALIDYRNKPTSGTRRRNIRARRFRYALISLVVWLGVESIVVGRVLAAMTDWPVEFRRAVSLVNFGLVSGALIVVGLTVVVSRLREQDTLDADG